MQIQTIFELYTDDNKSKYSKDILKSEKKLKNCTSSFPNFKIPNIKKISNKQFNLCEGEISLDEIIKFR